ncbi:MAG TPA: 50S ribosomal protein L17 [Candidatus Magasanikbacteria bacterium]|nr:50S ribosomal protein L17 [Candidatus Magasanikbacteria bacterium]
MRHQKKKVILDRKKAPRVALLKNLAASVVLYEKVKTTKAKAKAVQPLVEKMITVGKQDTLAARRELLSFFHTENPVKKIMEDLGKRYAGRKGGYTRIIKLGNRAGDAAEMVSIELV